MQYMLLIYSEPPTQPPTEAALGTMHAEYQAYTEDIRKRGAFVDGSALVPASSASTVRVRNGNRAITDGPFAETKEWLGGYYVIEAPSLDGALEAAAMCPGAKYGSVEVRPLVDMS
jgi:hypothetical protein